MKMAIIGATRGIGSELLAQSLDAGYEVTVLVRDPRKIRQNSDKLTVVAGDFLDVASLEKATVKADAVVVSVGTNPGFKPVKLFSEGTRLLLQIFKKHKINPLLIAVTGIGSGDSRGHGGLLYDKIVLPLILGRMYEDKDRQEILLRENYDNWICVRPGMLTNGPLQGKYRALTRLSGVHGGKISRKDVAGFIMNQIQKPTFLGQSPLLIY